MQTNKHPSANKLEILSVVATRYNQNCSYRSIYISDRHSVFREK